MDKKEYFSTVIDPLGLKSIQESSIENGTKITLVSKKISYNLTIGKKLGFGGFGSVYKCRDDRGTEYALKKIETDKDKNRGIPCLFEASMMSVYNHPSINRALIVNADPSGLYILQDIAICDLSGLYEYNNGRISMLQYKNILYRVAKGLSYLHDKGLVHGDVKCKNVLYYSDNDIRLNDFNLTTMVKWRSDIHLCTAVYRPIEVWEDRDWNEKIDIWSFGCMMYEMMYQTSLFSFQGSVTDKESRKLIKQKYINAIIDWSIFNSPGQIKTNKYPVNYNPLNIVAEVRLHKATDILGKSRDTYDYDKELYLNLMLRCLQVIDKHRPPVDTIISDHFFQVIRSKSEIQNLFKVPHPIRDINQVFYNIIERGLSNYVEKDNRELLKVSTHICTSYSKIVSYDNYITKKISVWIAKKLIRSNSKSQEMPDLGNNFTKEQVKQMEIEMCNALGFRLHT